MPTIQKNRARTRLRNVLFRYNMNLRPPVSFYRREYWLKNSQEMLANTELAGKDGFMILHVHYSGEWRASDTPADFDKKRSIITQINGRHTWDDCRDMRELFFKKCFELDKWREAKGTPILGNREVPSGWKWRDDSSRRLTGDTSCLRDLLDKGEQCRKVVRTKYVDVIATQIEAGAPSLTFLDGPNTKIVGPQVMPTTKEETSSEGGMQKNDESRKKVLPASEVASNVWMPPQNWAKLPESALPAPPHRILFVGANNVNSSQLCVEKEKRQMKLAFLGKFGATTSIFSTIVSQAKVILQMI